MIWFILPLILLIFLAVVGFSVYRTNKKWVRKPIKIHFCSKDHLWPKFGYAKGKDIYVAVWVPVFASSFLQAHETFHIRDNAKNWVWREIKANFYGAQQNFLGFLYIVFATIFSLDRWKFYFGRFRRGK